MINFFYEAKQDGPRRKMSRSYRVLLFITIKARIITTQQENMNRQKAASSFKGNKIGTSHDKKKKNKCLSQWKWNLKSFYVDIWKIETQYPWVSILALHWHCQKQLRPMEKHPYLFPIDAGRSSSYWLVFNVVHLISLSTLWFMTANRESVKPAF